MAFGFLKKNNFADTIFFNGKIFTQDPEFPEASAVSCKNGLIQAVGDNEYVKEFEGPDTELIDLEGKCMYPGFISMKVPFVYQAFKDLCLKVDVEDDLDYVLRQTEDYVSENPNLDTYFVFGFDGQIVDDVDMGTMAKRLDEISEDVPIILLDDLGMVFRMNTVAANILNETAEEECVEIITLSYVINIFLPFDYDESQDIAKGIMEKAKDMGFTSVVTLGTPGYMDEAFLNALLQIHTQEDLSQRFFFSQCQPYQIGNGAVGYSLVDKQTSCVELGDEVGYQYLNVRMNPLAAWDYDGLYEMCKDAIDRGFNVIIDCANQELADLAFDVLYHLRDAGFTKPVLALGLPEDVTALEDDSILRTGIFEAENQSFVKASSPKEALDQLTVQASRLLGMEDVLGTIEPDKYADFTVFDENILEFSMGKFSQPHAAMTVVAGQIRYDAQFEADNEMLSMIQF
ncbi:MAG: amidohydrolase family protein [Clostridia bacterium]|nr:amidohydrolase family protein [Clostridia bacterium]